MVGRLLASDGADESLRLIFLADTVSVDLKKKMFQRARLVRKPFPMGELTALVDSLFASCDGDTQS